MQVDWKEPINTPVQPTALGTKVFIDYPIEDVLDYIDWYAVCPLITLSSPHTKHVLCAKGLEDPCQGVHALSEPGVAHPAYFLTNWISG